MSTKILTSVACTECQCWIFIIMGHLERLRVVSVIRWFASLQVLHYSLPSLHLGKSLMTLQREFSSCWWFMVGERHRKQTRLTGSTIRKHGVPCFQDINIRWKTENTEDRCSKTAEWKWSEEVSRPSWKFRYHFWTNIRVDWDLKSTDKQSSAPVA